jgi:hypothetical protein
MTPSSHIIDNLLGTLALLRTFFSPPIVGGLFFCRLKIA